ncbi:hypothetical protein TNCV_356791 [Trichonephila clavipes]|nr:hypothetical protein TNCV_356791 [Trichonephila clavipes]
MSSFLVLGDGDTRNRWRDGQVCPDVGQGTMAPWARRPGEKKKKSREKKRREETRGEDKSDGERKGLSVGLEWKEDERRWR